MNDLNFNSGINDRKWQLILIPSIALLVCLIIGYNQSQNSNNFTISYQLLITLSVFTFSIWEVNLIIYRKLDYKIPFFANPQKRLIIQASYGFLATIFTFTFLFILMRILQKSPFTLNIYLNYFLIATGISFVVNTLYVFRYLQKAIYYREAIKTIDLNESINKLNSINNEVLTARNANSIFIDVGHKKINILSDDIAFFISKDGIVILVKIDGEKLITNYGSFNAIIEKLPNNAFFQLNRQIITNFQSIKSVSDDVNRKLLIEIGSKCITEMPQFITVSRYRNPEFKKWFAKQLMIVK